ncbi:phage protein NinX family protein [Pseudomonas frederiksbergensis]
MTELIEVRVAELRRPALDWAVAIIEGLNIKLITVAEQVENIDRNQFTDYEVERLKQVFKLKMKSVNDAGFSLGNSPAYSLDWGHCGPLIKKYVVDIIHGTKVQAVSHLHGVATPPMEDDLELVATCRAVIAAERGEFVKVPKILIGCSID